MVEAEPSVVLITSGDAAVARFGTGFVIGTNGPALLVVTCAHVVADVGGPGLVRVGGQPAAVCSVQSGEVDLAVLSVPRMESGMPPPLLLDQNAAGPGRAFGAAGFQRYGDQYVVRQITGTLGRPVGMETRTGGTRVRAWEIVVGPDDRLQPGYSGSPILDRTTGRVVAVGSHREGKGERGLAIAITGLDSVWPERAQHVSIPVSATAAAYGRAPAPRPENHAQVFVGREREMALLCSQFSAARAGPGTVSFVLGEAGSGKTTLVTKALTSWIEAEPDSALVAVARCDGLTSRHLSYAPFKEILEQVLTWVDRAPAPVDLVCTVLSDLGWNDLGPLSGFTGSATRALRERLRATTSPPLADGATPGDTDQDALFDCYWHALSVVARHHPLVLVIEDLHWADESTLLLLMHLSRRLLGTHRIAVTCTIRRDSPEGDEPLLIEIQDRLGGLGAMTVNLRLAGDQPERDQRMELFCADYLRARYGTVLSPEVPTALYRLTRANPLFLAEVLVDLEERGTIHQVDGQWRLREPVVVKQLPARVEQLIRQRVSRLDESLLTILKCGSVEGETFTAEVVSRVQGIEQQELLRAVVDRLMRAHQLVLSGTRRRLLDGKQLHTFTFHHMLTQRYVYDHLLTPIEREILHEEVGRCLEQLWGAAAAEIAPQLATHFSMARAPEQTVRYSLLAAESLVAQHGWSEVTRFARLGLATWREFPDLASGLPTELWARLCILYARGESEGGIRNEETDHIQAGIDALRPALARISDLGDRRLAAEAHLTLGRLLLSKRTGVWYDANEQLAEAARIYEELDDPAGVIAALSVPAYDTNVASVELSDEQLARRHRAVSLAEQVERPALLTKALADLALHYLNFPSDEERPLDTALAYARRAAAAAADLGVFARLPAQLVLSWVYHHCGYYTTELARLRPALLAEARRHGQTTAEAEALTDLGHFYSLQMSTQPIAEKALREGLAFRRRTGRYTVQDREQLAAYLIRHRHFIEAVTLLSEAPEESDPARIVRSKGVIAWVYALAGQPEQARAELMEAGNLNVPGCDETTLMRAHAQLGDIQAAVELADRVAAIAPAAARRGVFHAYLDHATELAETYRLAGNLAAASRWTQVAAGHWQRLAKVTDTADLVMYWEHRLVHGRIAIARGDSSSRRILAEAYLRLTAIGHYAADAPR